MTRYIADLHIHSRYARACSPALTPPAIDAWCRMKGVSVVAAGDCTHPRWLAELKSSLAPSESEEGLFFLREDLRMSDLELASGIRVAPEAHEPTRFMLGTEIACIKKHKELLRRVHHLVFFPSFDSVDRFVALLERYGCNVKSDGRPIVGMTSKELLQFVLEADSRGVLIPAHAWTPHFAVFGSKSGYNSLEECFEDLTPHIFAVETGLSSDPEMNWQLSALDAVALVSNSDAHSLPNIAREANVFEGDHLSWSAIVDAIRHASPQARARAAHANDALRLTETIEFYPHEGRYHYDGHRECGVVLHPRDADRVGKRCPACGRMLTVGVLSRVEALVDRPEHFKPEHAPGFVHCVELDKIIADAVGITTRSSPRVAGVYARLVQRFGTEMNVLLDARIEDIASVHGVVAQGIKRVREQLLRIRPGYDGVYGVIEIFSKEEQNEGREQAKLF